MVRQPWIPSDYRKDRERGISTLQVYTLVRARCGREIFAKYMAEVDPHFVSVTIIQTRLWKYFRDPETFAWTVDSDVHVV